MSLHTATLWRWLVSALAIGGVLAAIAFVVGGNDSPGGSPAEEPTTARAVDVHELRPPPMDAKADRPAVYDEENGCQVKDGDPVPALCSSGDTSADRTLMLVGDSKIAQWETAYSDLGKAGHWRVETMTKSACPFADVEVTSNRRVKQDCRDWGRSVLTRILAEKPEVVVVSQRASTALLDDQSDRTRGAMIRGLHAYWQQLLDTGIEVVVHLDNPFPTTHPVYQCVQDHADDVNRCAFDLQDGIAKSAAPVLREAAEGLPGVRILDMTRAICPDGESCPAVIDDVLLYRAGSHLTRTFVVSVEAQLARELARATGGSFDG